MNIQNKAMGMLSNLFNISELWNTILEVYGISTIIDTLFWMLNSESNSSKIFALGCIDHVVNQSSQPNFSEFVKMHYLSTIMERCENESLQYWKRAAIFMSKVITRCSQDELKLLQIEQIFKLITSLLENKVDPRIYFHQIC